MPRPDLSKPKPPCICDYSSYDQYYCEGCAWEEANRQLKAHQYMTRQGNVDGALHRFLVAFDPLMLKDLDHAIDKSAKNSAAHARFKKLRAALEPLVTFKQDEEYRWHYDHDSKTRELRKLLGGKG